MSVWLCRTVLGVAVALAAFQPLAALDLRFATPGASDDLRSALRASALMPGVAKKKAASTQEVLAAAHADYARLLSVLYAAGHYGGRISILLDGREASDIALLDAPADVRAVQVRVEPGPGFVFGPVQISPLAPQTDLPEGFRLGAPAQVGIIQDTVSAGLEGWRQAGHAKAAVSSQKIVADHPNRQLEATIILAPGPQLRFGQMQMRGYERMSPRRLAKIAGFPSGKRFDPDKLDVVRQRLRRTGIFNSVSLIESDTISAENTLDATLSVAEAPLRRLGFGAELSSLEGLDLSAFWLHRNLLGGGERLRIDGAIGGIGGATGGTDYSLGARIDRPATLSADTSGFLEALLYRDHEADYTEKGARLGLGFEHFFNPRLTGQIALQYGWSEVDDGIGAPIRFRRLAVPTELRLDNRDNALDASKGYFGQLSITPFYGFDTTGSGAQIKGDFRAYRALGAQQRLIVAGRLQFGGVFGSDLAETPRDYLFYSGGGGTVRGQPYQALGVDVLNGGTLRTGGTEFVGFSTELRSKLTETIGIVAFYDAGYVSDAGLSDGAERWHAGAGLGLRYQTGIGPIRLDVAAPVSGETGNGAQIYLGIGQAF